MKKSIKLLAFFAILILVSSAFSVFAQEIPRLSIDYMNLSFRSNVCVKYAVASDSSAKTTLLLWDAPQDEYTYGTHKAELESVGTQTISEKEYLIFDYTELAAKQMTDDVYARAYTVVGGKAYYSDVEKYSILKYAYNKLGKTATASTDTKLKAMLESMLTYGASAQEYFEYKADRLATDSFYQITVNGATLSDGSDYGLYKSEEIVTITAPATDSEGYPFSHWEFEEGTKISDTPDITIMVTTVNATYTAVYKTPKYVCAQGAIPGFSGQVYTNLREAAEALGEDGGTIYVYGTVESNDYPLDTTKSDISKKRGTIYIKAYNNDPSLGAFSGTLYLYDGDVVFDDITLLGHAASDESGWHANGHTITVEEGAVTDGGALQLGGITTGTTTNAGGNYVINSDNVDIKFVSSATAYWEWLGTSKSGETNYIFNGGTYGNYIYGGSRNSRTTDGNGNNKANLIHNGNVNYHFGDGTFNSAFTGNLYGGTVNGNVIFNLGGGTYNESTISFGSRFSTPALSSTGNNVIIINKKEIYDNGTIIGALTIADANLANEESRADRFVIINNAELSVGNIVDNSNAEYKITVTNGRLEPVFTPNACDGAYDAKNALLGFKAFGGIPFVNDTPLKPNSNGYYTIDKGTTAVEIVSTPAVSVTFDASEIQGVTGEVPAITAADWVLYSAQTIPGAGTLAKEDYIFAGWTYGDKLYKPGDSFYIEKADPITFKASFVPIIYVTFDTNGATSGTVPTQKAVVSGTVITIPEADIAKDDYIFAGWSDGDEVYNAGDEYIVYSVNVTFTAVWQPELSLVYVSSAGDDTNAGTTSAAPLATLEKAVALIGKNDATIVVMDKVTWTGYAHEGHITYTGKDPLTGTEYADAGLDRTALWDAPVFGPTTFEYLTDYTQSSYGAWVPADNRFIIGKGFKTVSGMRTSVIPLKSSNRYANNDIYVELNSGSYLMLQPASYLITTIPKNVVFIANEGYEGGMIQLGGDTNPITVNGTSYATVNGKNTSADVKIAPIGTHQDILTNGYQVIFNDGNTSGFTHSTSQSIVPAGAPQIVVYSADGGRVSHAYNEPGYVNITFPEGSVAKVYNRTTKETEYLYESGKCLLDNGITDITYLEAEQLSDTTITE